MSAEAAQRVRPGEGYRTVADLLDAHARRDPDKVAVVDVDDDKHISFSDLAAAVDAIARQLTSMGMRKGSRVVLLAENSIEKIVLWLAIWRIGAVVCPFDLSLIRTAAATILQTVHPDLVIAHPQQYDLDVLGQIRAPVARIACWPPAAPDAHADPGAPLLTMIAAADPTVLPPGPGMHDIACLTCTSGTTGLPKIVVYDHLAYWDNGRDSIELLGLRAEDRTLEYRSFGWYSAQILSLMPFLQLGLTLHLARKFSYRRFPEWIDRYRITLSVGVPTIISILINQPVGDAKTRFASLRAMTSSTAPLQASSWARFEERYGVILLNLYGSSETGWICGNCISARKTGTVGRPVNDVRLEIVSEAGTACLPGIAGQVAVRSEKLALGYLQADGSIHPIRGAAFVMRDIAVMDEEGFVRILGRTDDLVNRGGVKISPAEIEEVVSGHPDVLEAAAVGIPDPTYGQEIVCFIVSRSSMASTVEDIREYCALHLPREKVPVKVVALPALPRTTRGKLQRPRLVKIYAALAGSNASAA